MKTNRRLRFREMEVMAKDATTPEEVVRVFHAILLHMMEVLNGIASDIKELKAIAGIPDDPERPELKLIE